ncbi:uncharacterized protein LOC110191672 [Drosophila serrata]|uniref:uncharacterized protein LOC110191672 n=1 Tax=Drosophila serrata TaxID=7274 RepID=UPI000A1D247C|nr:uncharacterized protein LOC110191672 [Drosophila serrata]
MVRTWSRCCSFLSRFMALNGLYTFYFDAKKNGFRDSWKLKTYCLLHHLVCVLSLARMLYNSAGDMRIGVSILTMGSTAGFCIHSCWQKRQGIRKLSNGLIRMEAKFFVGVPSSSVLRHRFYLKLVFVSITLIRIHLFYPFYMKRLLPHLFVLNLVCYWQVYNMLLAAAFCFYCLLWQICRSQEIINNRMLLLLSRARTKNRLREMTRCLKLYSKLLLLSNQVNLEYGHVSVCVLACKSWYQITHGYEIFQMVAAPQSIDMSLGIRIFVVLTYILDAINMVFATDVAEMFTKLREDSRRILRETNRMDRLLSMFALKLSLHPSRVVFLNVFTFDRKLTLTLFAKSMLFTICWLQGDYNKLKS